MNWMELEKEDKDCQNPEKKEASIEKDEVKFLDLLLETNVKILLTEA